MPFSSSEEILKYWFLLISVINFEPLLEPLPRPLDLNNLNLKSTIYQKANDKVWVLQAIRFLKKRFLTEPILFSLFPNYFPFKEKLALHLKIPYSTDQTKPFTRKKTQLNPGFTFGVFSLSAFLNVCLNFTRDLYLASTVRAEVWSRPVFYSESTSKPRVNSE